MKVGLYHHGEMLFDLDSDPGEQHNMIADHPDIAQHLKQLMADFRASNKVRPAVNVNAAPEDNAGWQKLWFGIAEGFAVALLLIVAALWLFWRLIKMLMRK